MKPLLVENWENIRPSHEFVLDSLNETFAYLDRINTGAGNGAFDYTEDGCSKIKTRLLEDSEKYQWFIDIDITWDGAPSDKPFSLTPCLMFLDVRDEDLERNQYMEFFTLEGRKEKTPSKITKDAMIDEDFHGYFCTLTLYTLFTESSDVHDEIINSFNGALHRKIGITPMDNFMKVYDEASKFFPMRVEEFDELFGEEVNKQMMIYHALS